MKTQDEKPSWLQHFPIMFYTVVMGLGGLALAFERLNLIFDISGAVFEILRGTASLAYALICACYVAKLIKYPGACKAEFSHPVRVNFFAAFSIGTLLVASLWRDFAPVSLRGITLRSGYFFGPCFLRFCFTASSFTIRCRRNLSRRFLS